MNNKKQSSVEWLEECLSIHFTHEQKMQFNGLFEQAKEMHKEEMDKVAGDWWNEGASYMHDGGRKYKNFEEYYKETFEGQDETNSI